MPFNDSSDLTKATVDRAFSAALVPSTDIDALTDEVKRVSKIASDEDASIALAIICQKGGTAKRAQSNIYANVNGTTVDLGQIRTAMSNIRWKHTLRQFARTKADYIYKVCAHFGIQGDLAQKIGRMDKDFMVSEDNKYWLSNFQMENPNCPPDVKDALHRHYYDMFGKN